MLPAGHLMTGFELIGAEERAAVGAVLQAGVLMRYGFDDMRSDQWRSRQPRVIGMAIKVGWTDADLAWRLDRTRAVLGDS
jgi:hypothetical protein